MESHSARPKLLEKSLRTVYNWATQFSDPVRFGTALARVGWFLSSWHRYRHLPGAERIRLIDTHPQLHDRTPSTSFDAHYFYANGWAARKILAIHPGRHVDIGSQVLFANLLGAAIPVIYLDYRPLSARLEGLQNLGGSLLNLPFAAGSIESLSCLHVLEHVGLGRYGDPLDPQGTEKACRELVRVLAPCGNLYLAVPIGRPRLCFNAHRIFAGERVLGYFGGFELMGFAAVDDKGRFHDNASVSSFNNCEYACGIYWFKKPGRDRP